MTITERHFGTVATRSALFATLSTYLATRDGPLNLGSVMVSILGVKLRHLSSEDRTVLMNTLGRLGFEKRGQFWCRIERRVAA